MNDTDPTQQLFPTEQIEATDASARPSEASAVGGMTRPRTRWAGIIWGTVFSAVAVTVLVIVGSGERRAAFGNWANSLTVAGFTLLGVLALGCLLLLLGLLGAVRQVQRRRADR